MDIIKIMVPKKDHDIILKHQLSWYLIPILLIVWFLFPEYNNVFAVSMIAIVYIGIIETIFFTPLTLITKIYSILAHIVLLVPLFYNKIFNNQIKYPSKSCLQKNNNERKGKHVKFSNNNKNYYRNDFRYIVKFNTYNFILYILGLCIIYFLPYWPYYMSRNYMAMLLTIITFTIWLYVHLF